MPLHPENAELPMDFILHGIETEVRLLQSENAKVPIDITPLGILTDTRFLQPEYLQLVVIQRF